MPTPATILNYPQPLRQAASNHHGGTAFNIHSSIGTRNGKDSGGLRGNGGASHDSLLRLILMTWSWMGALLQVVGTLEPGEVRGIWVDSTTRVFGQGFLSQDLVEVRPFF
jgi:hypothetical protein